MKCSNNNEFWLIEYLKLIGSSLKWDLCKLANLENLWKNMTAITMNIIINLLSKLVIINYIFIIYNVINIIICNKIVSNEL